MSQTAQTKARTLLAQSHPDELRDLYLEEKKTAALPTDTKQSDVNSRARGRALSKLVANHRMEYIVIYRLCIMQGFAARNPGSRGS